MQQHNTIIEVEFLAAVETLKEFKGMLWEQQIKVYTDNDILFQDAIGLTSDISNKNQLYPTHTP
jgi:hypothetical protein